MKKSDMLKLMIDIQFNPPTHIQNMNDGGQQIIRLMDYMLDKMEEAGMFYCPVEQLGNMGTLRTPKGWDEE